MTRKEEVQKLWAEGLPVKEIIEKTGTLRQTIWRWTRGLPEPEDRRKLTRRTPEQNELRLKAREAYAAGSSLDEVAMGLAVHKATAYGWIKDLVEKNPHRESTQGRRYHVNDNFFLTPNVTNAYWAGLLAGDGNIITSVIRLSLKDRELVEGFKETTDFKGTLREYKAPQGGQMYSVAINSKQWVKNLEQFNVVPNKCHILEPPDLEHSLNLAYLKGLYDADGCLTHSGNGYTVWKVAGTRKTCEWVKAIADELVPEHRANVNKCKNTTFTFALVGSRAIKMLRALHAIETPELRRKWPLEVLN